MSHASSHSVEKVLYATWNVWNGSKGMAILFLFWNSKTLFVFLEVLLKVNTPLLLHRVNHYERSALCDWIDML